MNSKANKIARRLIILTLILMGMASCKTKNDIAPIQTLDLSSVRVQETMVLSQITDSISYIYLEDTEDSFIGQIGNLSVTKNYILISDGVLQRVLLFNKSGKFLKQIGGKGKGPGEYLTIFACHIDEQESFIYIYTVGDVFLQYSINGFFLRSFKISNGKLLNFKPLKNQIIFTVGFPNSILFENYTFGVSSFNGKIIGQYLKRDLPGRVPQTALLSNSCFYTYKDTACFWEYIYDTIYGLSNDLNLVPRWRIKYNNFTRVRPESFNSLESLNQEKFDGKFAISGLFETSNYFFLSALEQRTRKRLVYDKFCHKLIELPPQLPPLEGGIINDINPGFNFWPQYIIDENNLVAIVEPTQIVNVTKQNPGALPKVLAEISAKITERSNLTLMIIKLK
jgi:hypothetical protein